MEDINQDTGFHEVSCILYSCPPYDEDLCKENGGHAVPTDDGCCWKCDNKCVDANNNTYKVSDARNFTTASNVVFIRLTFAKLMAVDDLVMGLLQLSKRNVH